MSKCILNRWIQLLGVAVVWLAMLGSASAQGNRVTADQVADAIRNSPNASPWLRANADAVGRLAIFESGGRLDIYNGSCCTGVLQMNRSNIERYAGVSREVFATWSLQQQVNAWSRLTSDALSSRVPQSLIAMGTFDGRPVDGNLVLACVQLGIGNCQRMIRSGRCSGFADINGTTICAMADRIARGQGAGTGNGSGGGSGTGGGSGSGSGSGGGGVTPPRPDFGCVRGTDGNCMPMNDAMRYGFLQGSGVTMEKLRLVLQLLLVGVTLLVIGHAMTGVFGNFSRGVITKAQMIFYMQRGLLVAALMYVILSVF